MRNNKLTLYLAQLRDVATRSKQRSN